MLRPWDFLDPNVCGEQAGYTQPLPEQAAADERTGCICALLDWGVIRVHGADAVTFLHSQLSNDVRGMDTAESRLTAYCNAKGRAFALLRIVRTDDGFLLLSRRELIDSLLRRLRMFVLRSKVTLEDASEAIGVIGLAGPAVTEPLCQIAESMPEAVGGVYCRDELRVIRLAHDPDRFALAAPAEELPRIWSKLADTLHCVDPEIWQLLEIRAGIPTITSATQEAFVPLMLNLEALQGISYSKGCYPGQEVIARMHYLGRLKRRMYRLHTQTGMTPSPGETIRTAQGGNEAGMVVAAARASDGSHELLAVLRTELAERDKLVLNDTPLQLLDLPYTLEQESTAS